MPQPTKKIFVGSDHAGFSMKRTLVAELAKEFPGYEFVDCGCEDETSVDYPDYAERVAERVGKQGGWGILLCGSGIGMSISANKVRGIRAAEVWNTTSARLAREHNDANVLCMGARLIGSEVALDICRVWLRTNFEGGRHSVRVDKIRKLEEKR